MSNVQLPAEDFEQYRRHLRAVAYRMLGSLTDADDAVQEAWIRVSRADRDSVENLGGWLTTVTARVCLDMLRSRRARPEQPLEIHLPDPIVTSADDDPEQQALLVDAVGIALLVVLDRLSPPERLAFVLHDTFGVPFEQIAPLVDRTPEAARKLASRARQRVQGAHATPDPDIARQRQVVNAFLAAAREGDFDGLLAVLHPDVVLRADFGADNDIIERNGVQAVTEMVSNFASLAAFAHPVLINGAVGVLIAPEGKPFALNAYTVVDDKITAIHILADQARISQLDLPAVED
jgi:RNA polymerase sigma factor (sigma-70 family)